MSSKVDVISSNEYKLIGTLFNTYIVLEKDKEMVLVDQHALHERILFDKFNLELKNKSIALQPLLVPYILDVNKSESIFINENIDLLYELGFELEEFGEDSFKLSTVPMLFHSINIGDFFDTLLNNLDTKYIADKESFMREYIAKTACKSAVKANDRLSEREINSLVEHLNDPNQVLLCPHGRPVVVNIKQKEIEKWFKRIV